MAALYQTEITAAELREDLAEITREALVEEFQADARDEYEAKEAEFGSELMRELERFVVLQVVDVRWREHLENMEYLREGVHLRAMAQKDPLVEYTRRGRDACSRELGRAIRAEVVLHLFHAELAPQEERRAAAGSSCPSAAGGRAATATSATSTRRPPAPTRSPPPGRGRRSPPACARRPRRTPRRRRCTRAEHEKIGRNDPCWCGSGKKFKKCHGA